MIGFSNYLHGILPSPVIRAHPVEMFNGLVKSLIGPNYPVEPRRLKSAAFCEGG